jgi:hypothetical protein
MDRVVLASPVMSNFKGFTELMRSVDIPVLPYVFNNWTINHGVSHAWNCALKDNRDADVVIVCNDDIIFEPGCLQALVDGVKDYNDLVTAVNTRDFPLPENCNPNEPDYACFAVSPEDFLDTFGYFDENFTPAYFEDNDMAYRIKLAGGTQVKLATARMYHIGSQTQFKGGPPESEDRVVSHEQFRKNQAYYRLKWGGLPGHEQYKNPFNKSHLDAKQVGLVY